jgi:hypothetical protein
VAVSIEEFCGGAGGSPAFDPTGGSGAESAPVWDAVGAPIFATPTPTPTPTPEPGRVSAGAESMSALSALAVLTATVDALAVATDPAAPVRVEGEAAVQVVRETLGLVGRLSAIVARTLPTVEADGWWALDGARSITTWVAAQGRTTHRQAAQLVTLGRAFRDVLPATAAQAVAGVVPIEAAHVIAAAANTKDRRTALAGSAEDCGEGFLLKLAGLPAAQFRVLTRRWMAHADPGADDRGHKDDTEREFLNVAQTMDGCHLRGFLTTEHGHALQAALTAVMGTSADAAGEPAPRRRAGALMNLVRLVLDRDLSGATGSHRPQITVVTDLDTLNRALNRAPGARTGGVCGGAGPDLPVGGPRSGPVGDADRFAVADLVGTGPIPDTVLARLACDSAITRVVFGPQSQSQILNVGRAERTYTGAKRRAIIARDRHCRYPGCDSPPAMSEVHHTEHWHRDNGSTDVATGVLLCWHHHEVVHDHGIEIARNDAGRWKFTDRHGHPLRT